MATASDVNLAGKDYLTTEEAAHYACVSPSQFRRKAEEFGIYARTWMGKVVWRKSDIQREIEQLWQN